MSPNIASLRVTRSLCLGVALAFWILAAYGLGIGLELLWVAALAGVGVVFSYLVIDLTRLLRIVTEVEWRKLQ